MWFPYAEAHGDHSPDFSFALLFPRPLRPIVGFIGDLVHSISAMVVPSFVKLRDSDAAIGHAIMYDPSNAENNSTGRALPGFIGSGVGGAAAPGVLPSAIANTEEYNTRRAKALQLLDDNINSL